jgi:hypothetical protein
MHVDRIHVVYIVLYAPRHGLELGNHGPQQAQLMKLAQYRATSYGHVGQGEFTLTVRPKE